MAKAIVRLNEGYRTTITTRQHTYHCDEQVEDGGTDTAPNPPEMLMGALGSCLAITMKMYAQRKGWALDEVEIALDYERFTGSDYADYQGDAPFVHEILEHIVLHGALTADQRERLLDIASKCPVSRIIELPAFMKRELLEAIPES